MAPLIKLIMFLITMKFPFIQMLLTDKEDYFNHNENELPEFFVDESLFTSGINAPPDQPWITKKTSSTKNVAKAAPIVKTLTVSTKYVKATFGNKLNMIHPPPPTAKLIRSIVINVTTTPLPFWSGWTHHYNNSTPLITLPSTASTDKLTTYPTNGTTTSTKSYMITLTPKSSTTGITTKSTAISTIATTRQLSTTTPARTTLSSTQHLTTTPTTTTTKISWYFYITPKTKKLHNTTTVTKNISTTVNGTTKATGNFTELSNVTTRTVIPTGNHYFEARLDKIRPGNPTIATISTVFQDLTLIRKGLQVDGKPKVKFIGKLHRPIIKQIARNSLNDKETIEYKELTTEPFSKFLELLTLQLALMDSANAAKFLRTFERQMAVLINMGKFDALGPAITTYIMEAFKRFHFPIDHKQKLLSMAHAILAYRNDTLKPDTNYILDYMDMLYAVRSEVDMERVLNETKAYPNINKTAEEITEGFIEDVLLNPLERISSTIQGNKLLAAMSDIISNKNFNARRLFSETYYKYPKEYKKLMTVNKYRKANKTRRPKFVFAKDTRKGLFVDKHDRVGAVIGKQGAKSVTIVYRNEGGDIKKYVINSVPKDEVNFKNTGITKDYSRSFVDRDLDIQKDVKLTKRLKINSDEIKFRASFHAMQQSSNGFNPFRTLLYKHNIKNRFDNSYTEKDIVNPHYLRTMPTTNPTKKTPVLVTSQDKKKENNTFDIQLPSHESKFYHKQRVKYNKEANKDNNKNIVRQSMKNELKHNNEAETKINYISNDIDAINTTRLSEILFKSIKRNKVKTTQDTKTSQSEFKEPKISLKHFYFKPVIIAKKSGDSADSISIEFDEQPSPIDFSVKVKVKNRVIKPTTTKKSDLSVNTIDTTTAVATTNGFRVLDPYKMDSFFKNNGSIDSENNTKKGEKSSTDSSASSSDDSGKSEVSSGSDSVHNVFGKLRKIKNHAHKQQKSHLRKNSKSKKHRHGKKHKGHQRHEKYGKKWFKFLKAYLKKKYHNRKKLINHKLKHLINRRIVGKNFEIDFDASDTDNDQNNLIDVTIVKSSKDGKRATISLFNKRETLKASHLSNSREKEKSNDTMAKKHKKNSVLSHRTKDKGKRRKKTTKAASTVETTGKGLHQKQMLRNLDHTEEDEHSTANNENSDQEMLDKLALSAYNNVEITLLPKETNKNKISNSEGSAFNDHLKIGNKNSKGIELSPLLIEINKPNKTGNKKFKSHRKVKNKFPTARRRYFPSQAFNDSEYIDEEDELKRNLYDTFRHQDDLYYRKNMRYELPLKNELWVESDVTDEEVILKGNIYKAIKENNRRNYQH